MSRNRSITLALVAVLCVAAFPATGAKTEVREKAAERMEVAGDDTVAEGNNAFACDLYGKLRQVEGSNFFFSPFSIRTALAMTYAGARGETAEQMAGTLKLDPQDAEFHGKMGAYIKELNKSAGPGVLELSVANALWGQKGFSFLNEFVGLNKAHYEAGLNNVDFIGNTEGARQTINSWVEDKTKNKIKNLVPPGAVTKETRLVLTNAIYFLGTWIEQFRKEGTKPGTFRVSAGKNVEAHFMYQKERFWYAANDEVQVLEMRYKGDRLGMTIILPKEDDGLGAFEDPLTAIELKGLLEAMRSEEVRAYIPKFKIESRFSLRDVLAALGMSDAFTVGKANFSGMTPWRTAEEKLFISDVIHKTYVDVNEEGTEAAAATAVVMYAGAAPPKKQPPIFRADHPFLFLIRDHQTGTILFMGRLVEP